MIHILLDLGLIYITEVLLLCFTKQQSLFLATGTKLDPVFSAFCSLLDLPVSRTICLKRSILVYCWMDEDDIFAQIGQIFFDTFFWNVVVTERTSFLVIDVENKGTNLECQQFEKKALIPSIKFDEFEVSLVLGKMIQFYLKISLKFLFRWISH